jgi:hypothetical protein
MRKKKSTHVDIVAEVGGLTIPPCFKFSATSDGLAARVIRGTMRPVRLLPRGLRLASWDLNLDLRSACVGELAGSPGLEASACETSESTESIDGISLIVVTDDIRE